MRMVRPCVHRMAAHGCSDEIFQIIKPVEPKSRLKCNAARRNDLAEKRNTHESAKPEYRMTHWKR